MIDLIGYIIGAIIVVVMCVYIGDKSGFGLTVSILFLGFYYVISLLVDIKNILNKAEKK